jgi:hypothetical protein
VGNEANCVVRFGGQKARGKAQLETSELTFRSEDGAMRLKFPFAGIKSVAAADGHLRVEVPEGEAIFELGANAAKWCQKILHPKTRVEKLGIKPNAAISLIGNFAADFLSELRACTKNVRWKSCDRHGVDFFRRRFFQRSVGSFQTGEEPERRGGIVDRISKGPNANHGE